MKADTKPQQRRASAFTGAQVFVMFLVFLLLISVPVWTHLLPPLSDYVNHLARMHVIATIDKNPNLAKFYQIDWAIIPNLTMDLVVPWLTRFVNVYVAGKIFTVAMFAVIGSGVLGAQPRADRPLVDPAARWLSRCFTTTSSWSA